MKILNYISAFKLKVSSAITAMLPDRKTIEKLMVFQHFEMHPLGGWGVGEDAHMGGWLTYHVFEDLCRRI